MYISLHLIRIESTVLTVDPRNFPCFPPSRLGSLIFTNLLFSLQWLTFQVRTVHGCTLNLIYVLYVVEINHARRHTVETTAGLLDHRVDNCSLDEQETTGRATSVVQYCTLQHPFISQKTSLFHLNMSTVCSK
jgi:hypothetical protein